MKLIQPTATTCQGTHMLFHFFGSFKSWKSDQDDIDDDDCDNQDNDGWMLQARL